MFYKYITDMNIFLKKYFIIFTVWSLCTFIFEGKISLICDIFYKLLGIDYMISIPIDNLILRLTIATLFTTIQLLLSRHDNCKYSSRQICNIIFENNKLFRNGVYFVVFILLCYNLLFLLNTLNLVFINDIVFRLNLYIISIMYFFILFCYFNTPLSYVFIGLGICKNYKKDYKIYHLFFGDLLELIKGVGRSLRNVYGDSLSRNTNSSADFVKSKPGSRLRPISNRILPVCNETGKITDNAREASNGIWSTTERFAFVGTSLAAGTLGLGIYKEKVNADNAILEKNIQLSKDLYTYSAKTDLEKFRYKTALRIAGIDTHQFEKQDEYFEKEASKNASKVINNIVK